MGLGLLIWVLPLLSPPVPARTRRCTWQRTPGLQELLHTTHWTFRHLIHWTRGHYWQPSDCFLNLVLLSRFILHFTLFLSFIYSLLEYNLFPTNWHLRAVLGLQISPVEFIYLKKEHTDTHTHTHTQRAPAFVSIILKGVRDIHVYCQQFPPYSPILSFLSILWSERRQKKEEMEWGMLDRWMGDRGNMHILEVL